MHETDADRVREAYARRLQRRDDDRYALADPVNLYLFQRRERAVLDLMGDHRLLPLDRARIVDVGCGNGSVLRDFMRWGAAAHLCAGIDLLEDRVAVAREMSPPGLDIRCGSAEALPWADASFDIAVQFTLLSSVLDVGTRRRIAAETMRLLRPGGALLYYDFIWNPGNRDTRGLRLSELRTLYEGCAIDARRTTLAPPISRQVARLSWTAARLLEAVPILRSHYIACVIKPVATS